MSHNNLNHEVEMRAILTSDQQASMLQKLEERGAKFKKIEPLIDMYFCPKSATCFDDIQMNEVGTFSLRLRKKVVDHTIVVELNTKIITTYGDHHAWEEHEVVVNDFGEAQLLLQGIGFKPFFTLDKKRYVYECGSLSINLDDIKDFGMIIELEIMAEQSKTDVAKSVIKAFLHELGITDEQIVPKSVTNILMQKQAIF